MSRYFHCLIIIISKVYAYKKWLYFNFMHYFRTSLVAVSFSVLPRLCLIIWIIHIFHNSSRIINDCAYMNHQHQYLCIHIKTLHNRHCAMESLYQVSGPYKRCMWKANRYGFYLPHPSVLSTISGRPLNMHFINQYFLVTTSNSTRVPD